MEHTGMFALDVQTTLVEFEMTEQTCAYALICKCLKETEPSQLKLSNKINNKHTQSDQLI